MITVREGKRGVWCFGSTFLFCRVNSAFFIGRRSDRVVFWLVGWLGE